MSPHRDSLTLGQRAADRVAAIVGSWAFLVIQTLVLVVWIAVNLGWLLHLRAWDPYPFILLNLILSFQAAYTGPIVTMVQNRQSQKDRGVAHHTDRVITHVSAEVAQVHARLDDLVCRMEGRS